MRYQTRNTTLRPGWRLLLIAALLGVLTACGTTAEVSSSRAERFEFTVTVEVSADAVKEVVEAEFGGRAVVWRPEAGFAILGLDEQAASELTLAAQARKKTTRDTTSTFELAPAENMDVMVMPEVYASGFTSYGGGFTSWSGGFTSWSGGFTSWSGGFTSWSGGTPEPTTFIENVPLWNQIKPAGSGVARSEPG